MKLYLLVLGMLPAMVSAQTCVLQNKTVTRSSATVQERTALRAEVVPSPIGRKCMVSFRARIGSEWHSAFGEFEWPGDRPREEACAVAVNRADSELRQRVAQSQTFGEQVMICNDNPDMQTLRQTNPGTIGNLSQFRPHPDRPREFWHNGARCRYFLDTTFVNKDITTFEGVICQVQDSQWVVIDKF